MQENIARKVIIKIGTDIFFESIMLLDTLVYI